MSTRTEPITKEMVLISLPATAYKHAQLNKGPFKAGEPIIATDPKYSYWYAKYILRGPFPLGEPAIYKDKTISSLYQTEVLDRDFEGEDRINNALRIHFGLK